MENRMGRRIKKPFYKRKRFGYTLLFLAVMIFVGAGYYAFSFYNFANTISKPKEKIKNGEEWTGTERINIALIGVDTRPGDGAPRGDTMMVLSIDPQTKDVALFSVMRDTWYKIPGYGFRKINEAHALGGPHLVVETLEKFMQIDIDYYVKTDFNGFANIVDVLGGIDMYVEKDMYHPDDGLYDINLKKGQQHLDGKHALMYVRYRGDAMSDFARTERQRKFLSTLAAEMRTTSSLLKLPQILKAVQDDIETDMSFNDMIKLGKLAYNLDINTMDSVQLPPMKDSTGTKPALMDAHRGGASVIIPDLYETRLLVHSTLNTGRTIVKTFDDQEPLVDQTTPPKKPTQSVAAPAQPPTPPPPKTSDGKSSETGSGGNKSINGTTNTTKPGGSGANGNGTGTTTPNNGGSGTTPGGTSTGGTTDGTTDNGTKTGGSGGASDSTSPPGTVKPPATS
ncbi:LCP family protein [Effusibacillus consociatus]|uniref:LCP family protein n=1 Tax=Effusibacillus consociatus TaxID=1117041 RepID=A0ABV9Q6U2_9BACL